ncbi:Uncharacterized protein TPAR_08877 [Tolypocladium paradoxum]|uniref:Uncharacterized protein n=1 Tax=Tolypocladium paradoxum TaxID=94208 RepID=A0A2S4KL01_9HYPO|nr:Uncharacterized protein TPAR_08877 [Tolypocladium paradoxum]
MQLSTILLAALPALALAQGTATSSAATLATTTCTSTTVLTKTLTLSQIQTVTFTRSNSTSVTPTVGTTSYFTTPSAVSTGAPSPSVKGPNSAACALDATKMALAGFVGMLAVAMM